MSDNSSIAQKENELETVIPEETSEDAIASVAEAETGISTGQINEQGQQTKEKSKKKGAIKDAFIFARDKIFTSKAVTVILILLGCAITLLSLLQIVFWGLKVKDTYLDYWNAIKTFDYGNIILIMFILIFLIALLVNTIKGIISLIKKGHEVQFETVSTIFAFYVFAMFVTEFFGETTVLISNFKFEPLFKVILILTAVYAVLRLFVKDFGSRLVAIIFSVVAIALSIVMFTQKIGNFATFTAREAQFSLSQLNIFEYFKSVKEISLNTGSYTLESIFYVVALSAEEVGLNESIYIVFLQFIPIMASNLLPYVAISMLGYLMFCLVSSSYLQYYNLKNCNAISVTMLVVSIISAAAVIGMQLVCKSINSLLVVEVDYTNIIMTIVFCIVMIIITSLPWKIYNSIYIHRYKSFKKAGGGN